MDPQRNTTEDFLFFNLNLATEASVSLLTQALCYGVFLTLTWTALHRIGNRPSPRSLPTKMLCWLILFLWIVFTAIVALGLAAQILMVRWPQISASNLNISLEESYDATYDMFAKLQMSKAILHPIPYMAADALPLWRCYVVWLHSRKAKIFFVTVWIIDVGKLCVFIDFL
ncbi:hypothetical protein DL96DRAFT_651520 [Flagelloscypha sp. PMI_526]|nr:hypothetical protein DL96DRAFT_651520 [Flagelloscypha sp. PMI_526]